MNVVPRSQTGFTEKDPLKPQQQHPRTSVWTWLSIGSSVATGIYLIAKKPKTTYGETTRVLLMVPAGWRRVTDAEIAALPELGTQANALRNVPGFTSMSYGTLAPFVASNGKTYATWIEQHYHEPDGVVKPWGLHHGVTVLTPLTS